MSKKLRIPTSAELAYALEQPYAKAWVQSVNENGDVVHFNPILNMTMTKHNPSKEELDAARLNSHE